MPSERIRILQRTFLESGVPDLYLDANVLVDLIRPKRRPVSERLVQIAQERGWSCTSSVFALMEALDAQQENTWLLGGLRGGIDLDTLLRGRRDREVKSQTLGSIQRRFRDRFVEDFGDFIGWVQLEEEGWDEALHLALTTSISAPDCVHLATALITGCTLIVTSDQPFQKKASRYIPTDSPDNVIRALGEFPER